MYRDQYDESEYLERLRLHARNKCLVCDEYEQNEYHQTAYNTKYHTPRSIQGEYTGKKEENQGVIGILTLIKEDVEDDIATADQEEADSKKAFEDFKAGRMILR
jgi:hypothetical protein